MSFHRMTAPSANSEIRIVAMLAFAAILAGCETAQVSGNGFLITSDNDAKVRREAEALDLRLPNGNLLRFVVDRDARVRGLLEHRRAGNRGIASVPDLTKASIPEIYFALAEPDSEIPEPFRLDRYPEPQRPQGWARDIILTGGPTGGGDVTCAQTGAAWNAFRQEVVDQGYALVFLSAADGATSKPNHWHTIETDWMSPDGHELRGAVDGAAALYVSVMRCEGSTSFGSSWGAPRFSVSRRPVGENDFELEVEEFLPEAGNQVTYMTPGPALGSASDYRVFLRHYEGGTRFHFGAAWQKPSGTFGPNP